MATASLSERDGLLLNALQESFPLVERPFSAIGAQVGITEEEALDRTIQLRRELIIRQIGAIFDTRSLGYKSSLVAFKAPPERLMDAVRIINRHPGVSHNYERDHPYNLWFTIAVPPGYEPEDDVQTIAEESGCTYRMLPTLVLYKIGVKLDMTGTMAATATSSDKGFRRDVKHQASELTAQECAFVRVMQRNMEYCTTPFAQPASELGMSPSELFAMADDLAARKVMRRFAAILRHQAAGYNVNAMGVWVVPAEQCEAAGEIMAGFRNVSHCYRRPT